MGLSFRPRILARIDGAGCDPNNCFGYILPERVVFPWTAGAGVAYRFSGTPWNQTVASDFRDEKSTILAADVILTGPVTNGDGIDSFLEKQMQQSVQHPHLREFRYGLISHGCLRQFWAAALAHVGEHGVSRSRGCRGLKRFHQ